VACEKLFRLLDPPPCTLRSGKSLGPARIVIAGSNREGREYVEEFSIGIRPFVVEEMCEAIEIMGLGMRFSPLFHDRCFECFLNGKMTVKEGKFVDSLIGRDDREMQGVLRSLSPVGDHIGCCHRDHYSITVATISIQCYVIDRTLSTARERGSDIIDLQDFAGHSDPRTTLTYIRTRDHLSKSPAYVLAY
jgi:hypothetical protein